MGKKGVIWFWVRGTSLVDALAGCWRVCVCRYTYDRQYDMALQYLLQLGRSNVFDLIRKARAPNTLSASVGRQRPRREPDRDALAALSLIH
jgi:hypothetical protein